MSKETIERVILYIFYTTVFIGFIGLITTLIIYKDQGFINTSSDISPERIGTFGDFIGGFIGTIFTISATLLIWLTYTSQKAELAETNKIASEQFENMRIQQFENTFFNLLKSLSELPNTIIGELPQIVSNHNNESEFVEVYAQPNDYESSTYSGRDFFIKASEGLIVFLKKRLDGKGDSISEDMIKDAYYEFYNLYLDELDNYFRLFYNIIKFVDQSKLKNKFRYMNILQAQLSKYELSLIYYNSLGPIGKPKLYGLLEKYNLLENINISLLYTSQDIHYRLFRNTTFRFLPEEDKISRIIESIKKNNDKMEFNDKNRVREYYFSKYNCEGIRKTTIMEELEK